MDEKYCYFYLSVIPTSPFESNLIYLHILTERKRFLNVLAGDELIKGWNSQKIIKEYQCIINVDPALTHRSSSDFKSGSDETQVGSQGTHTICLCSRLLFYSKCTDLPFASPIAIHRYLCI